MKFRLRAMLERRTTWSGARVAGFDPDYYLASYPDIRESGSDPLRHYLEQGWKEGRDPSAGFSTCGYLAANPDVAEAGDNPLLHFVKTGLAEGRGGFTKDPKSAAPYPARSLTTHEGTSGRGFRLFSDESDMSAPQTAKGPQGNIDEFFHDVTQGWVLGAVSSNSVAEVEIYIEGTLIGTALGDVFRSDIKLLGFGNGWHGFRYEFKPPLSPYGEHRLMVRRAVDKLVIGQAVLQGRHFDPTEDKIKS